MWGKGKEKKKRLLVDTLCSRKSEDGWSVVGSLTVAERNS